MANFSLIYDGLVSLINGELTGYTQLTDSVLNDENSLLRSVKGYTLAIGGGSNTNREICPATLSMERVFDITVVNLLTASQLDTSARSIDEKALFEDCFKIWKKLETVDFLGGIQVANAKYLDDSGIEYFFGDNTKAISITSSISVEYFE